VVVADIDTAGGPAVAEHIQGSFVAADLRQSAACRSLSIAPRGSLAGSTSS
jgi:hypothetical protein